MAGAEDPVARSQAPPEVAPKPAGGGGGGSGLRIGGWILAGIGGLLVLAGVALVVVHLTQRDKDGYYTSSTLQVAAPGYAVTSEGLHIGNLQSFATDAVGQVRVSASSRSGRALFVGIASQDAVNGYLAGVARSEVTEVNGNKVSYKILAGGAPAAAPARESFWQSASSGSGQVTTTWKVKGGTWLIVLMNSSGAPDVSAAVRVGAKTNLVLWVGLGLLVVGLITGGGGTAMVLSSRSR
jgi:hypothetical protein